MHPTDQATKTLARVYVAKIPEARDCPLPTEPLFPPTRQAELVACASEKVRREKYFSWLLLFHAIEDTLGVDPRGLQFFKSENGKWLCDGTYFSISHSDNLTCIALLPYPVGVDVERLRPLKTQDFALKILSEQELADYHATPETEKSAFLLRAWTRKESLFKRLDQSGFFSANPKTLQGRVEEQTIDFNGEQFTLAVAADLPFTVQIHHYEF